MANLCRIHLLGFRITSQINNKQIPKEAPIIISNSSLKHEIMDMDFGFTAFLATVAKPAGFHTQNYLEARNSVWVIGWNIKAQNPIRYATTSIKAVSITNRK